jgi:hypothetical protein
LKFLEDGVNQVRVITKILEERLALSAFEESLEPHGLSPGRQWEAGAKLPGPEARGERVVGELVVK